MQTLTSCAHKQEICEHPPIYIGQLSFSPAQHLQLWAGCGLSCSICYAISSTIITKRLTQSGSSSRNQDEVRIILASSQGASILGTILDPGASHLSSSVMSAQMHGNPGHVRRLQSRWRDGRRAERADVSPCSIQDMRNSKENRQFQVFVPQKLNVILLLQMKLTTSTAWAGGSFRATDSRHWYSLRVTT